MTTTLEPTTSSALKDFELVDIDSITIGDRYRKNPDKNLDKLAESIDSLGLLNPVVLTSERVLVAGHRRLLAVQSLGYEQIEAHIVRDLDELGQLQGEQDENVCRENFTIAEAAALAKSVAELLAPAAKEAQLAGLKQSHDAPPSSPESTTDDDVSAWTDTDDDEEEEEDEPPIVKANNLRTREAAAAGTGYSGKTLERYNKIKDTADDDTQPPEIRELAGTVLAQVDSSEKGVVPALAEITAALEKARGARGQKKALNGAVTAIEKQALALEKAFLNGGEAVDNFDTDCNPEDVALSFKDIRAAIARINKVSTALKGLIG